MITTEDRSVSFPFETLPNDKPMSLWNEPNKRSHIAEDGTTCQDIQNCCLYKHGRTNWNVLKFRTPRFMRCVTGVVLRIPSVSWGQPLRP